MTETAAPADRPDGGDAPRFNVLIPCYNYGRFLASAVGSALSQAGDIRVLVIDDASKDDSEAVGRGLAERDPRVTYVRHAANRGHIATYNEGIDWAEGGYFTLLSADDLLMPGALARAAAAFRATPGLSMVYGRALYFTDGLPEDRVLARAVPARRSNNPCLALHAAADLDGDGVPAAMLERPSEMPTILDTAAFYRLNTAANRVHACSVVAPTEIQQKVGGYRPSLPHSGDYEMWLRFSAHGPVAFVPQFHVAARQHRSNMSIGFDHVGDVLQRAAALQELERNGGPQVPQELVAAVRRYLAAEALRATTSALEKGAPAERLALERVAEELDPEIRRRWCWSAYRLKLAMGHRGWRLMSRTARPVLAAVRSLAERDGRPAA